MPRQQPKTLLVKDDSAIDIQYSNQLVEEILLELEEAHLPG